MKSVDVRRTTVVAVAGALLGAAAPPPLLADTIDALRKGGPVDRHSVQSIVGTHLSIRSSTGPFAFFAGERRLRDATVRLDWREPVPGRGATAGPHLNLFVISGCPLRLSIERRYGPLTITDVPHGHSLDEQTGLSRDERWGRMSFGFAERSPACLASISFEMARR